jgi:hypothetical protein
MRSVRPWRNAKRTQFASPAGVFPRGSESARVPSFGRMTGFQPGLAGYHPSRSVGWLTRKAQADPKPSSNHATSWPRGSSPEASHGRLRFNGLTGPRMAKNSTTRWS